jgi:hypothetical protein
MNLLVPVDTRFYGSSVIDEDLNVENVVKSLTKNSNL